jgi:hypothetical protein
MMQRTDIVALVAGTTVGMGGAFLLCTAGRALTLRLLNPCSDLGQQAPLTSGLSAEQVSQAGTPATRLTSSRLLNECPERGTRVSKILTPAE